MLKRESGEEFDGLIIEGAQTYEQDLVTRDLAVTGTAVLFEDLEAARVDVPGRLEVRGMLSCDEIEVSGSVKCRERFVTERANVSGRLSAKSDMNTESLNVYGKVICRGSFTGYDVYVSGEFSCLRRLKAERVNVSGYLRVDGTVYAQRLVLESRVRNYMDGISVDRLVVKERTDAEATDEPAEFILRCTEVDCRKATLNKARIDVLNCDYAEIGPGCFIDEIFCKEDITVSPEAQVGRIVRLWEKED